jgi:ERCC4-type nuclease
MNAQQRDHQTAVTWIEGELDNTKRRIGQPNASAAAISVITLSFLLRAISEDEQRMYAARIDMIYAAYNASLTQGAPA